MIADFSMLTAFDSIAAREPQSLLGRLGVAMLSLVMVAVVIGVAGKVIDRRSTIAAGVPRDAVALVYPGWLRAIVGTAILMSALLLVLVPRGQVFTASMLIVSALVWYMLATIVWIHRDGMFRRPSFGKATFLAWHNIQAVQFSSIVDTVVFIGSDQRLRVSRFMSNTRALVCATQEMLARDLYEQAFIRAGWLSPPSQKGDGVKKSLS